MSDSTPTLDEIKSWYAGAVDEYRCDTGMSLEEGEAAFDRATAALRGQIAAEIEQQAHSRDDLMQLVRAGGSTDWVTGWMTGWDSATLTAAEIARGES